MNTIFKAKAVADHRPKAIAEASHSAKAGSLADERPTVAAEASTRFKGTGEAGQGSTS